MMDSSNGITPVMPIGNNDFGSSGFMWILMLFFLLAFGGGGFGWGGNSFANAIGYENLATSAEMQRSFDNQNNMANQRDILSAVTNGTAQTIAASTANASNAITAIKDGNASIIREFGNVENGLTALSGKQQECCCNTLRAIDSVNYNGAVNTAQINSNIAADKYDTSMQIAQMEARLAAKMDANEIQSLRDQVQQLQIANATAGMLKFPQSWAFNGGNFPPLYGCGCQNI